MNVNGTVYISYPQSSTSLAVGFLIVVVVLAVISATCFSFGLCDYGRRTGGRRLLFAGASVAAIAVVVLSAVFAFISSGTGKEAFTAGVSPGLAADG